MSPPDLICPHCGATYDIDDIFCESCGYVISPAVADSGAPAATPVPAPGEAAAAPQAGPDAAWQPPTAGPRVRFGISADRAYFDAVVAEGELEFPDPPPPAQELERVGTEHHIGRTSQSRAIHPDVDVADLTGDPAVSSRHAVITVGADGVLSVRDVGSKNGTVVGSPDGATLKAEDPTPLDDGQAVYVGAWTRITVNLVRPG